MKQCEILWSCEPGIQSYVVKLGIWTELRRSCGKYHCGLWLYGVNCVILWSNLERGVWFVKWFVTWVGGFIAQSYTGM